MFQEAGVVIVFNPLHPIGERKGHGQLDFIIRLIFPVTSLSLAVPCLNARQSRFSGEFLHIVGNPVFIQEPQFFHAAVFLLMPIEEQQIRVDNCLPFQNIPEILRRDADFSKDFQVRQPVNLCTGFLYFDRGLFQATDIDALFKMQLVTEAIPIDFHVHIGRGKLRCTQPQAVQAQRIGVVVAIGVILSAGIQFTEHQFPVIAIFLAVKVHRAASPEVLDCDGMVVVLGDDDFIAKARTGFINGVGDDFKYRVCTAVHAV